MLCEVNSRGGLIKICSFKVIVHKQQKQWTTKIKLFFSFSDKKMQVLQGKVEQNKFSEER